MRDVTRGGWLSRILDLVYPPACVGCGRGLDGGGEVFCPRCDVMVAWRDPARCRWCDHPTGQARRACPACLARWPRTGRVVALGYHAGPLRRALRAFKVGAWRRVGEALGEKLARRVVLELGGAGVHRVVPVPGGRSRQRRRGFDPSEVVAAPVARALGVPLDSGLVERVRDGERSRALTRLDREVQVQGRFAWRRPAGATGHRLLLVDDVYTTGESMEEVARLALEEGGARSVLGAVVSRAVVDLSLA
jgi:ComF family protein